MENGDEIVIYQLRVVIEGISPLIWRRFLVPGNYSIADLHYILQIAFGWENAHLHRFVIYGKDFGIAYVGGMSFWDNPYEVRLANLEFRKGEKFLYEYDFGKWYPQFAVKNVVDSESAKELALAV